LSHVTGGIALLNSSGEGFPDKIGEKSIAVFNRHPDMPEGCFAVHVDGDYMAPKIRNGDVDNRCIYYDDHSDGERWFCADTGQGG